MKENVSPLICIPLKSAGIGNCMFQYAAARACAISNGGQVRIDISDMLDRQMPFKESYSIEERIGFLNSSLGVFKLKLTLASEELAYALRGWGTPNLFGKSVRKVRKIAGLLPKSYYAESNSFAFDPSVMAMRHDVYLDGLFINPKYFHSIEKDLREDFSFNVPLAGENEELAHEIESCNSVSIHVRMGDYTSTSVGDNYPGYGRGYYERAMKLVEAKIDGPRYYIFSDNPEWVRSRLSLLDNCTIVSHNAIEKGYEDLRLMSLCKHNIITNSTFSWWGAWLNKNSAKIVVTPRKWFSGLDNSDLLLDGWCVLDANG